MRRERMREYDGGLRRAIGLYEQRHEVADRAFQIMNWRH